MIGGMTGDEPIRWIERSEGGWDEALAEVVDRELSLLRPEVRADALTVGRLLHDEFEEFGASGRRWDRAEVIAALAAEPGDVMPEADEFRAVRLADDVVLLTYRARRPGRVRRGGLRRFGGDRPSTGEAAPPERTAGRGARRPSAARPPGEPRRHHLLLVP